MKKPWVLGYVYPVGNSLLEFLLEHSYRPNPIEVTIETASLAYMQHGFYNLEQLEPFFRRKTHLPRPQH